MPAVRNKNRLTHAQFHQAVSLVASLKEEIIQEQPMHFDLAARLTRELGFIISAAQIKQFAELAGVEWTPQRPKTPGKIGPFSKKVSAMEKAHSELAAEVAQLRFLVHDLYRQLEAEPPPGYHLPH